MLTGYWRATHAPDVPPSDFLVGYWWACHGPSLVGRHLLAILDVPVDAVSPDAWRAHCQRARAEMSRAGVHVAAVQIGEELYGAVKRGDYDAVLAGQPELAKLDIVRAWLDGVAIPIVRETWPGVPVTCLEAWWYAERVPGWYSPVPAVDVLGIDPYCPHWALGRPGAFEEFVALPLRVAAGYGRPVHLVGQAFAAPGDPLWAVMPSPAWLERTRALAAATPQVVALSWFAWASTAAVQGLATAPAAHLDALGVFPRA